jgi:hypothetical protein
LNESTAILATVDARSWKGKCSLIRDDVIGGRINTESLMNIASLLCSAELDFGTTELLTRAFDQAWQIATAGGGPHVNPQRAPATRTVLATRIIDMVLQGERDLDVLIDGALDVLSGVVPPENAGKAGVQHKRGKRMCANGARSSSLPITRGPKTCPAFCGS